MPYTSMKTGIRLQASHMREAVTVKKTETKNTICYYYEEQFPFYLWNTGLITEISKLVLQF